MVRANLELKIDLQSMDTNKAKLAADNRQALDAFIAKQMAPLRTTAANIGVVIISGHADKMGNDDKANKFLSEKRAQAVRDYVANKGSGPANSHDYRSDGDNHI